MDWAGQNTLTRAKHETSRPRSIARLSFPNVYVFSANGAMSKQPGASPQDCDWSQTSAEGATQGAQMNRAFSAVGLAWHEFLGRCPRLRMNVAPLALNTCPTLLGKAEARAPRQRIHH